MRVDVDRDGVTFTDPASASAFPQCVSVRSEFNSRTPVTVQRPHKSERGSMQLPAPVAYNACLPAFSLAA
jgi:hypothetical protein